MPSTSKDLIIIGEKHPDQRIEDYFACFNFKIRYSSNWEFGNCPTPLAFIIHASFIESELSSIQKLYQRYARPIVIISEAKDDLLCIQALEQGADDFLIKPFHPRELHARITAIDRRILRSRLDLKPEKNILWFGNWCLDSLSRQLFNKNHQKLPLSAKEYALLLAFIHQPKQTLAREFLSDVTKQQDLTSRQIDVQVNRLRQKLEINPKKPMLIKTIRNKGYMFSAPVTAMSSAEASAASTS